MGYPGNQRYPTLFDERGGRKDAVRSETKVSLRGKLRVPTEEERRVHQAGSEVGKDTQVPSANATGTDFEPTFFN